MIIGDNMVEEMTQDEINELEEELAKDEPYIDEDDMFDTEEDDQSNNE